MDTVITEGASAELAAAARFAASLLDRPATLLYLALKFWIAPSSNTSLYEAATAALENPLHGGLAARPRLG